MNQFTMNVANVGDVEAVLCRRGEALLLTKKFSTTADRDECQRVLAADGIVTEVSTLSLLSISPSHGSTKYKNRKQPKLNEA